MLAELHRQAKPQTPEATAASSSIDTKKAAASSNDGGFTSRGGRSGSIFDGMQVVTSSPTPAQLPKGGSGSGDAGAASPAATATATSDSGSAASGTALSSEKPPREETKLNAAARALKDSLRARCQSKQEMSKRGRDLQAADATRAADCAATRAELEAAQRREEAAIASEDYDAAAAAAALIDSLGLKLSQSKLEQSKAKEAVAALDLARVEAIGASITSLERTGTEYEGLRESEAKESERRLEERKLKLQRREDKAQLDLERVTRKLGHMEVDLKHVNEEESDIQNAISGQTRDVQTERDKLKGEAIEIAIEVEGCQRLKEREAALAERNAGVARCDAKISEARKGYERQLTRISRSVTRLKDNREALEEKAEIEREADKVAGSARELEAERDDLARALSGIGGVARGVEQLIMALRDNMRILRAWSNAQRLQDSAAAAQGQDAVPALRAELESVTQKLVKIASEREAKEAGLKNSAVIRTCDARARPRKGEEGRREAPRVQGRCAHQLGTQGPRGEKGRGGGGGAAETGAEELSKTAAVNERPSPSSRRDSSVQCPAMTRRGLR